MNKTIIIEFVLEEVALKLWNVSRNMRKRIKWILKDKTIFVENYSEKVLFLNGWVHLLIVGPTNDGIPIKDISELKKGISNYKIETQEHADALIALNGELRGIPELREELKPVVFAQTWLISIRSHNYSFYTNIKAKRARSIQLHGFAISQVKAFLSGIDSIGSLILHSSEIDGINLADLNVRRISLVNSKFTQLTKLSRKLQNLMAFACSGYNNLICKKLETLCVYKITSFGQGLTKFSQVELDWLKNHTSLKKIEINGHSINNLEYLPSSLREIKDETKNSIFYMIKKDQFPYLIAANTSTAIGTIKGFKLRSIDWIPNERADELPFRPFMLIINSETAKAFDEYPELFENLREIEIRSNKFKLDCLPETIKKVSIKVVNKESTVLTRLEAKCVEIQRN